MFDGSSSAISLWFGSLPGKGKAQQNSWLSPPLIRLHWKVSVVWSFSLVAMLSVLSPMPCCGWADFDTSLSLDHAETRTFSYKSAFRGMKNQCELASVTYPGQWQVILVLAAGPEQPCLILPWTVQHSFDGTQRSFPRLYFLSRQHHQNQAYSHRSPQQSSWLHFNFNFNTIISMYVFDLFLTWRIVMVICVCSLVREEYSHSKELSSASTLVGNRQVAIFSWQRGHKLLQIHL